MQRLTVTNEQTGSRYVFPAGWSVEYRREPRIELPGLPIEDRRDKGPAFTPPIRRHFWPRPSSSPTGAAR